MRERGVPEAPFYTNAGEKNTKDGGSRSVQPLKIRHSQHSGPVVCSVTSSAAARSPSLAGDQWSSPSPWCLFLNSPPIHGVYFSSVCVRVLFVYLSKCLAPGRGEGWWQSDMEIQTLYGAWAGVATTGSGRCIEATPEDLNLGRWRPNLFSTPAKVAAARR